MLEIFCAIYPEAKPLIQHLHLKKDPSSQKWDRFINEQQTIRLTLTGTGKVNASSAVAMTLMDSMDPFVISFGSSAYLKELPFDLYQGSCICDIDSAIAYYPDVVYELGLKECGLLTGSQLLSNKVNPRMSIQPYVDLRSYLSNIVDQYPIYELYDTESSAIYETANLFVGPHKMVFLRFPSDQDAETITGCDITQKVESLYPRLQEVIQKLLSFNQQQEVEEDHCVGSFKQHIHSSKTMNDQIDQIIRYCRTIDKDYVSIIHELMNEEVKDKEEGKKVFHEFQKRCCEA